MEEEEKDEVEPVVHHDEEEEEKKKEIVDAEEGHQGIVPTFNEDSFEDDFQIYNETEFVISNNVNSTDEVVGIHIN